MIMLDSIFKLQDIHEYKIHFAVYNGEEQPLDVFVRDKTEWQGWNEWRNSRDDFSRKFIFSLIRYYPKQNCWLFGGIYEVLERSLTGNKVVLSSLFEEYIGRLLIRYPGPGVRGRAFYLENHFHQLEVQEVFDRIYSGEDFCGFDNVQHGFELIEQIIRTQKLDWKTALLNIKGVYLIVDKSNGMKYVGSAYGDTGIWSRWEQYIYTGHGWNVELTNLITEKGIDYARKNFQFSILEFYSMKTDDQYIINREQHWKDVLYTKIFGYNRN